MYGVSLLAAATVEFCTSVAAFETLETSGCVDAGLFFA
jgi:hypothetical protein